MFAKIVRLINAIKTGTCQLADKEGQGRGFGRESGSGRG